MYKPGDPVVYTVTKSSAHPGPRAQAVDPSSKGDHYTYVVDKFWVVAQVRPDGKLLLKTRRGKPHIVAADDPQLRPARWWERLWYRRRFPRLGDADAQSP